MTLKQYKKVRLFVTVVLAVIFSQSIVLQNYVLPVMALAISYAVLMYLRSRVKEVIADERDYAVGGKSALLVIQIYSWIAVVAMFVLYALRDSNVFYEPVAVTLAFSACGLMLLYSLVFRFYAKAK